MGYVREEMEEAVGRKRTRRLAVIGTLLVIYFTVAFIANIWPFSSAVGVMKKVTSPAAIIQNHEWFYDQYHAIQAQRRNIEALPESSTDRIGTQMVLNNMISEYNAKSREITRNCWRKHHDEICLFRICRRATPPAAPAPQGEVWKFLQSRDGGHMERDCSNFLFGGTETENNRGGIP
jgi:hypothetical protein